MDQRDRTIPRRAEVRLNGQPINGIGQRADRNGRVPQSIDAYGLKGCGIVSGVGRSNTADRVVGVDDEGQQSVDTEARAVPGKVEGGMVISRY